MGEYYSIRLVFFGDPGMGKSETCNTILKIFGKQQTFVPVENSDEMSTQYITRANISHQDANGFHLDIEIIECPTPIVGWDKETYIERIIEPLDKILEEDGITAIVYTNSFRYPKWHNDTKMTAYRMFGFIFPEEILERCIIMTTCSDEVDDTKNYHYSFQHCKKLNEVLEEINSQNFEVKEPFKFPVYTVDNKKSDREILEDFIGFLDKVLKKWPQLKHYRVKKSYEMPVKQDLLLAGAKFVSACKKYQFDKQFSDIQI